MNKNIKNNLIEISRKINFNKLINKILLKKDKVDYIRKTFNLNNNEIINFDILKNILNELNYFIVEEFDEYTNKLYIILKKKNESNLSLRLPIVSLIGCVDSGKTSILDCIEINNFVNNEVGGITQYIRSFKINYPDNKNFIFIDTPGHESFIDIRKNCIKISDILVLVISVDDLLKINIINNFINEIITTNLNIKLIIIINKIDKINDNIDDIQFKFRNNYDYLLKNIDKNYSILYLSAKNKKNINLLINELKNETNNLNLKCDNTITYGIVIESFIDKSMGPAAKIIIKDGIINVGDLILFDYFFCKIKLILDENNNKVNSANSSNIIKIFGLSNFLPNICEKIIILNDIKKIKSIISYRNIIKNRNINNLYSDNYNNIFSKNKDKYNLNYIIKTNKIDINNAILYSIDKLSLIYKNININIIKIETGDLKKNDIFLALNSNSELMLFNINLDSNLTKFINNLNIKYKIFLVIYDLIDYIECTIKNILELKEKDNIEGYAYVLKIFNINKINIIGCKLESGIFYKKNNIKIFRKDILLYNGIILSMKSLKNDINEANNNMEFGIIISKNDLLIKKGDKLISFKKK